MATLIQSKQIEGVVTASVIEGNFTVQSGSVDLSTASGVSGSFSGSFVGNGSGIVGVQYTNITGKPVFKSGNNTTIVSSSNVITISSTGGGTSTDISHLNSFTSSYFIDSASFDSRIVGISASGSGADWNVNLQNIPSGLISGSVLRTLDGTGVLSASVDFNTYSSSVASTIDSIQHTQIPQGTISSSQQISDLGFIDTQHTDISALNTFTSSAESRLSALESATGSYLTSETDSQTLSIVGDQLTISSGNTITIPTGSGGTTDISALNTFTSSADTRITNLENFSSSLNSTFATDSELSSLSSSIATTIDNIQHTQIPSGTVSGSSQLTSSYDLRYLQTSTYTTDSASFDSRISSFVSSGVPAGTISSSAQVVESLPSGLVSGSTQITDGSGIVSGSVLRTLDGTGVVSGSVLTTLDGTNVFSGSIIGQGTITITSGSGNITISGSGVSVGGGDVSFDGDRVVSNTLLGELYSQSFNAGTSGSIQDFLTAVFFPSEAPSATFSEQTSKFNTNLATNGTNLVSVSLTDTVDNSPYTLVLSGTNASSLTAVPTNAESSSWEIRANGNLSSGTYSYDVTVGDSTNAERTYSGRSISIAEANTGSFSTTGTLYIIESATTGPIYLSSTGRSGAQGGVSVSYSPNYGSQVATNFQSSNPLISINSTSGLLSLGSSISGSGNVSGDTITSTITYNDQYGNSGSNDITINVTTNNAPSVSSTQVSNNNTNQARNTNLILQLTITDTEGDSIPNSGLVFSGYNTTYFSETISTPYMQLRANSTNVPAGTYAYTASLADVHGFSTREVTGTFTINTPDDGTLSGDINNYIIESAVTNDVLRDATGYNGGNASRVTVSYSPNYGSQVVQSFTSTNPAVLIDSSGYLTLGVDLSGSVTQSGDTFTSTIGWTDQYGNTDSRSINVTVFGNNSPSVSFTDLGLNTETAVSGAHIGTLTISDTETDTPFSASIGGTDGGKFEIVPQNANSSSYYVYPTGSLIQGDYSVQFVVVDDYSESATLNETISVSAANDYGKVYIYTNTRTGGGTLSNDNYDALLGITSENTSFEPDLITGYQSVGPSPIYELKTGELGASSITVGGGTMTLRATVSGSNLDTIISSSFSGNGSTSEQIMIIFPSGSDMDGIPTSMTDTLGGSTNGEYVLYLKAAGESSFTAAGTQIHMFDVDSAVEGYTRWNIIGRNSANTAASYEVRLIPSSGSAP